MGRRLGRHERLEIRRRAHEDYLRRAHGPSYTLRIERGEAVIRGVWGGLVVRMPKDALWDPDALSKRGF